jgi:hypothetical protein
MKKLSIPKESEFGTIIANGYRGIAVERKGGAIVFISGAFNPLTSEELRAIANSLDTLTGKELSQPEMVGLCS